LRGADRDECGECCEDMPLEGVFEFELGSDVRSVSIIGGFGLLDGLECLDMAEGDREEGKDDREVLRLLIPELPFEMVVVTTVSDVPEFPLVLGRCIANAFLVAFVVW
jgi:hypothetical protein